MNSNNMRVTKRNGETEEMTFDKILTRIKKLSAEANININCQQLVIKVIDQLFDKIETTKIDELAAEQCAALSTNNPDYGTLAGYIIISNHQKNTDSKFSNVINELYNFTDIHGKFNPLVSLELWDFVTQHAAELDDMIDNSRDYLIDYFGFKTLERAYLFKKGKKIIERPQHMWMRVSVGIHGDINNPNSLALIKETYDLMSQKYFTHATPTLFNAGTPRQQMSSCYLLAMEEDSIDGIFNTLKDCASISKYSGGIGLHIHNIRAKGSHIQGTNGTTDGIVPMLRVFNNTARYVNQCFTPDTWVYSNRGPIQMENVTTNDELITIDGSFKKVNEIIINNVNKEILEISITNSVFPVRVTKEHELYLIKNQSKMLKYDVIKNRLDKNIIKPNYYSASELSKNDLVGFPLPTFEKDNDEHNLDYYKFYGMMLVEKQLEIENDFLHLPKNKIMKIIEGLLKTVKTTNQNKELNFSSSSQTLIMQLRYLLLRLGILTSGYVKESIKTNKNISYSLRIPKHNNLREILNFSVEQNQRQQYKYFEWNGFLWGRIKNIKNINYEGSVYDFNMMDNHNYLTDMGLVHNSGKRNGSFAIYLETWHADIFDFLEMRKNHGDEELKARDLFYALWVSDLFMQRVKEPNGKWSLFCPHECPGLADVYGDKFKELYENYEKEGRSRKTINARELWFAILDAQMETGTPYLLYKDAVNNKSNQKNIGTIKSSNLCVAPETLILTDKGHIEIQTLVDQEVNVWNGDEWSSVTVKKTGEDQELIDVYTDDGSKLTCTPYHKFYVQNSYSSNSIQMVEAKDLMPNDKLIKCDYPIIDGFDVMSYDKNIIPSYYCSIKDKLYWFAEFCDYNGCINKNDENEQLQVSSINKEFLENVKLLLQTCGINPLINIDEQNQYYILLVTSCDLFNLVNLGFNPKRLMILGNRPSRDAKQFIKILKVENNNRIDDTYCFTEPKRHMGIFNGIITGQCTEITEYSDATESAVCNLASIALPAFVNSETKKYDFDGLMNVTKVITNNLNRIIDINFYPTEKTRRSNFRHRPIGIGVQGLADTFVLMDIPFHSDEAKELNKQIFETIYYGALTKSNEIAIEKMEQLTRLMKESRIKAIGHMHMEEYSNLDRLTTNAKLIGAYSSFEGSPASEGILQFDMWNISPSTRYDWTKLKESIKEYGLRNSLLVAPMPTASTSQILGYNECFEPFTSNLYSRRTLAGEFVVVNKYLMKDLINLGYWNENIKNNIIANKGSIQQLTDLPEHIRNKYKIVWEIPMKHIIDMSADRGPYICQSQSLNLWMEEPVYNKLTSMHFYAWEKGLKTGIYYLRRKAKHQAQQFTIEPEQEPTNDKEKEEICEMCSA